MTGKEQAAEVHKDMFPLRDSIFKLKEEHASRFYRETFQSIFENKTKIHYAKYMSFYFGFDIYPWNKKVIDKRISHMIENMFKKYNELYANNYFNITRTGLAGGTNLFKWNTGVLFYYDEPGRELRIRIKLKLKGRWWRFDLYKDNIEYKLSQAP